MYTCADERLVTTGGALLLGSWTGRENGIAIFYSQMFYAVGYKSHYSKVV